MKITHVARRDLNGYTSVVALAPAYIRATITTLLLFCGCGPTSPPGFKEQILPLSTDPLKSYPALFSVDRARMGFPPLPTNGTVRILTVDRKNWKLEYPPPNYDVSFQFCEGSTFYPYSSRFVALKHGDGELKWVSEQMVFDGPKRYTVDGQLASEAITLTCEVEQVAYHGTNIAGTVITYAGPDKRLAPSGDHGEGLSVSQGRSHFAGVGLQIRSGESSTRTLGPRRGHRPLHIL